MGFSEWLSIAAIVIAGVAAAYTKQQAKFAKDQAETARESLELQKTGKFSIDWNSESKNLRVRNDGSGPVLIRRVIISRVRLSWEEIRLGLRVEPTGAFDVYIPEYEFKPVSGDQILIRYERPSDQTPLEWTNTLP